MSTWHESTRILDRLRTIAEGGGNAAIAVLVRIEGSSYRRPGAKMLVGGDGSTFGSISGGCLEEDVRNIALEVIGEASPRRLRYKTGSEDETVWGLGLGCDGVVELFVHPATCPGYVETIETQWQLFRGSAGFSVATVIDAAAGSALPGHSIVIDADGIAAGGTGDPQLDDRVENLTRPTDETSEAQLLELDSITVFLERHTPPPSLLVVGGGDDAIPLVRLATDAGFRVSVLDHRAAYLRPERFPEAWHLIHSTIPGSIQDLPGEAPEFAVVKTHSLKRDRAWVRALASLSLSYVGLLGPRGRREEILGDLSEGDRRLIFGPVGLDIGAEGAEQVALSIVAELLAVASGRQAGHLRDAAGPIHERPPDGR